MAASDLAFRVFAIDDASVVFKRIAAATEETGAVAERTSARTLTAGAAFSKFASIGAASAVLAVGAGLKMAASFQSQTTTLVTSAGESERNLSMVGDGIRKIAVDTGTSTSQLIKGLYTIESAGYHGAAGLNILSAAAKGAKAENADLGTVANAVTTAYKGFSAQGYTATDVVNALTATVQLGKTNLEDLAGALASVSPAASTAGISMTQMLGAMAVMTGAGVSADKAAVSLRQTILSLEAPTAKQQVVMQGLGLNSVELSKNLGKTGLVGTLNEVVAAIQAHMGPAGTVLIDSLKKAATSGKDFDSQLQKMAPTQRSYVGALADMFGGTKSLQGALILTAGGGKALASATDTIAAKVRVNKNQVMGWSEVQQTLNFKLDQFQAQVKNAVLVLGQQLLPVVTNIFKVIGPYAPTLVKVAAGILAFAVAAKTVALAIKLWSAAQAVLDAVMDANPVVLIIVALVALAAGIVYVATKTKFFQTVWADLKHAFEDVAGVFVHGWHDVEGAFSDGVNWVKNFLEKWWPFILGIMTGGIGLAVVEIHRHWSDITSAFSDAIDWVKNFVAKWWPYILVTLLTGGFILVVAAIYRNWDSIKKAFSDAITFVKNFVLKWWPYILGVLTGGIALAVVEIVKHWDGIKNAFSTAIDWVKSLVMKWWPYILVTVLTGGLALFVIVVVKNWATIKKTFSAALSAVVNAVTSAAAAMYHGAVSFMTAFLTGSWSVLKALPGWIAQHLTSIVLHSIPNLYDSGKNLFLGFLSGAWSVLKDIYGWLKTNMYDKIVGAVKGLFGISSPSKVMAGLGVHIIEGLIKGIVLSSRNAGTVLKNTLGGLSGIAKDVLGGAGGFLGSIGVDAFSDSLGKIPGLAKSLGSLFGGLFGGGGNASPANAASEAIVQAMASARGWTGAQWTALKDLLMGESGFNANAVNPSSGAAGIFQSLGHGPVPMGNAAAQSAWGLNYIAQTYGNPVNAYGMWLSRSPHWYGDGGIFTQPTIIGVGERGPEAVVPLRKGSGLAAHGGDVHVHLHNATIIGGNRRQAARDLRGMLRESLRADGKPASAAAL